MRRPTQGPVIKERVWCFVEALLTHAEDSLDFEVHWETDKGTDRPIFVVNTQRRFLESLTQLKTTELTEVIKSLENLQIWDDRRLKRGKGSPIGAFALKLWSRDAERNHEQFERVWEANRPEKSKALEANYQKSEQFDWQNICKIMLEKQKEMTTNRLMGESEMIFDINQIHVPLALVERKKQDKHNGDDNPAQSHSYKPDYEETQKFEYEEFLAILKSAASNKIAIIGEPGAGKTTLLQRIAFWVLENTDNLAIWIPLGNLPTTGIIFKDYLLNNWLQNAIQSVTPEIKADFDKQLSAGRVWLLLDGVDEMATSGNSLSFINNWLPAWSHNLHFVLTCRLNVWEANPYSLNGFQTYRTLEFNQEQVKDFINNCFQNRRGNPPVVAPTLGIELQQALNQPGKERIKDLVRNPLRLMLLCSTWQGLEGKLPDTKAELYQHFVDEVYRWKKDELRITPQQRKELNTKLKELALAAIDKEENRFCLREKFVEIVLGECDDELFQFALKVGWLNRVGVDAKNLKPVYAFFHPTFQEYFAALAVEDWRYFLNHVPENPAQGIYRIFEPQWKEVILLWLGREAVGKEEKEEKEEFIKALVEFEDGCGDFYKYRAYFLAAMGTAEFKYCSLADEIVEQLLRWTLGYFDAQSKLPSELTRTISQKARVVLRESDRTIVIHLLTLIMLFSPHPETKLQAAISLLLEYKQESSLAITTLNRLLESDLDNWTTFASAVSLCEYFQCDLNNPYVVKAITNLSKGWKKTGEDDPSYFFRRARFMARDGFKGSYDIELSHKEDDYSIKETTIFGTFAIGYPNKKSDDNSEPKDYDFHRHVLQLHRDREACVQLTRQLENKIGKLGLEGNDTVNLSEVNALIELVKEIPPHSDLTSSWKLLNAVVTRMGERSLGEIVFKRLGKASTAQPEAVDSLIEVVAKALIKLVRNCICLQPEFYLIAIDYLGKIGIGKFDAVEVLLEVIHSNCTQDTRIEAVRALNQVLRENLFNMAATGLMRYLQQPTYVNNQPLYDECYKVIWHCAQTMPYPAFHKAWHPTP